MGIIIFDQSEKRKKYVRRFLHNHSIYNGVVASFSYCMQDYCIPDGGFIVANNGLSSIEKKGIFEEIYNLKGPIILYGRGYHDGKLIIANSSISPIRLFEREDSCWVEDVFSRQLVNAYWRIYTAMIYKDNSIKFSK